MVSLAAPNNQILTGSFARGWKVGVDNSHLKMMAQKRLEYLSEVLAPIQRMFMKKGWI